MKPLKQSLYLTKHIRFCERKALDELPEADDVLMLRAGRAAFNTLKKLYPDVRTVAIFCGGGNNAGDGYVLAKCLHQHAYAVTVYQCRNIDNLPPPAKRAALAAIAIGVPCQGFIDTFDSDIDLVVDALLGIGIKDQVHGLIAQAITTINDSELPVLSIDIPSGLNANTGQVLGVAINASVTVTFIAYKIGMFTLDGPDHCGKIVCHHLEIDHYLESIIPAAKTLDQTIFCNTIAPRQKNSHKGCYGHVLVIGGGIGMPGATFLTAFAAFRIGAGSVSIATLPEHAQNMLPMLPETMIYPVKGVEDLLPLLTQATIVVIGPGLGEDQWANSLFQATLSAQLPLVIDASALRLLALQPQHDDNWILTPHPGEAASLLATTVKDIQSDRCQSAHLIQQRFGGSVVLKGVGSIITSGTDETYLCTAGNPGMASAGMGDVLSGVIGGLLAQGMRLTDAAKLGVWLHAKAADNATLHHGERGLIASDLMPYLRREINKLM